LISIRLNCSITVVGPTSMKSTSFLRPLIIAGKPSSFARDVYIYIYVYIYIRIYIYIHMKYNSASVCGQKGTHQAAKPRAFAHLTSRKFHCLAGLGESIPGEINFSFFATKPCWLIGTPFLGL
jgi:hypothetical protein